MSALCLAPNRQDHTHFSTGHLWFCGVSAQVPIMLCDKTFPQETQHPYLLTPDRDPMTDQEAQIPTMSNLVKLSFIGIP